jgi:hypothetical protein
VVSAVDWISDPWIARGIQTVPELATVAPTWDPPDAIDAWPTFGVEVALATVGLDAQRTRDEVFVARLDATPMPQFSETDSAITELFASDREVSHHADERDVFGQQVRAWLLTAVGPLLRGLLVSPGVDSELIAQVTVQRLGLPFQIPLPGDWVEDFCDRRLALLFNLRVQPDGMVAPLDVADLRTGQGEQWQMAWSWLSEPAPAEIVHGAVRLAARLLRNSGVREGLARALESEDLSLQTVAVAVCRRWALALKAMTWVEDALLAGWDDARPADIVCFGFNATKPDWPRRVLAISHRSVDVKPQLRSMGVWKSSRCAIDANYLPAWETNTGMIWGLFAATPGIVRVATPSYPQSVWCRREAEIVQYLLDSADFISNRVVVDLDMRGLPELDKWDSQVRGSRRVGLSEIAPEFPGIALTVWSPRPLPTLASAVLRAGGALRAMSAFLRDPLLVNMVVADLMANGDIIGSAPAPTNNPAGWLAYAEIFRGLADLVSEGKEQFTMGLPDTYDGDEVRRDDELTEWVPDLSSGTPALDDILVAIEFIRTVWPIMVDQGLGRFLVLNLQGLHFEEWLSDGRWSLHRGLIALRSLPVPLWLLQRGGQEVSTWMLPGDRPIFTEHVDAQFGWMWEADLSPNDWLKRYPADSGLDVSTAVRHVLEGAGT